MSFQRVNLRQCFAQLSILVLASLAWSAAAADYVFTNVNVVTMENAQVLEQHAVVIEGDRIAAVIPMAELEGTDGAELIDGRGLYLLPGLAEMHGHVPPLEHEQFPDRYLDDTLFLYLAGGITTVRGMLGHSNQLALKNDVQSGARLGPNLYLAGPSFNGNSVNSPEQAQAMVGEQVAAGWDLLKVHPGLTLTEFSAMAEAANTHGIDFAGHIPQDVPLDRAMALGIRTIDHLDGYIGHVDAFDREITDDEIEQLVNMTLEHEVGVVPTQALWATLIGAADRDQLAQYDEARYMPPGVRDGWQRYLDNAADSRYYTGDTAEVHQRNRQRLLGAMADAEVEILMGTDAPQVYSVPGLGLKRELAMMADAGMTPYQILYSGTVAVGRYFAEQDTFGKVAPEHRADLVLVAQNPLEDIMTLAEPQAVMVRGRYITRAMLDEKLAEIEAAYQD